MCVYIYIYIYLSFTIMEFAPGFVFLNLLGLMFVMPAFYILYWYRDTSDYIIRTKYICFELYNLSSVFSNPIYTYFSCMDVW